MIDERLVELGPYFMPALRAALFLMAMLALWLLYRGRKLRSLWRVTLACLLMSYPVAVALALVGVIK